MYAVIFKATINKLDSQYFKTAKRLRQLATSKYGCLDFVSLTEGDQEIAISYWPSTDHISAWKDDPEHRQAQQQGQKSWYRAYKVEVVKIEREYTEKDNPNNNCLA
jgi:heme-degrading monooxygenase HmoA